MPAKPEVKTEQTPHVQIATVWTHSTP
jgi:hypothetical protein